MSAVLQFEVSRSRLNQYMTIDSESGETRIRFLAEAALYDTLKNGGTFVLVVSDTMITLIQHDDAKNIDK